MLVVAAKCSPVLPTVNFFPESGSDCIAYAGLELPILLPLYLFVLVHNFINFYFYLCMCVCVCILLRSEEEVRSPGGGVTGGCEPPNMDTRN